MGPGHRSALLCCAVNATINALDPIRSHAIVEKNPPSPQAPSGV